MDVSYPTIPCRIDGLPGGVQGVRTTADLENTLYSWILLYDLYGILLSITLGYYSILQI